MKAHHVSALVVVSFIVGAAPVHAQAPKPTPQSSNDKAIEQQVTPNPGDKDATQVTPNPGPNYLNIAPNPGGGKNIVPNPGGGTIILK